KQDEALAHYQAELHLKEDILHRNPKDAGSKRRIIVTHNFIAQLYEDIGKPDAALEEFQTASRVAAELVSLDSSNADWQRDLATNKLRTGEALINAGNTKDGIRLIREAGTILT